MKTLAALCLFLILSPQSQSSDQSIALILNGQTEMVQKSEAEAEHQLLNTKANLTAVEHGRLAALAISLGTDPTYCTEGQVNAGLCLPEQLETKEQR